MPVFAKRNRRSTRSPLKAEPLHNPGESLEAEHDRLLNEHVASHYFIAAAFLMIAVLEILFLVLQLRPSPLFIIAASGCVIAYAAIKIAKAIPELHRLRLGIKGEKAVGQFLEHLRSEGYSIFHDIVTPSGNIDHALVGPGGVFAIETKTESKPTDFDAVVSYDGTTIRVDGFIPDRDPIVQTKAVATELAKIIEVGTQRFPFVRPVVLYPGWFVEKQPKGTLVWVLSPRAFPAFLRNEVAHLSVPEIAGIRASIDSYIRTTKANSSVQ